MELILTSLGVSHLLPDRLHQSEDKRNDDNRDERGSDCTKLSLKRMYAAGWMSYFPFRMPPLPSAGLSDGFLPDYGILLLCKRVILDAETWTCLSTGKYHPAYENVALLTKMLHREGFIRIEDFGSIVNENRSLLKSMLARDLKHLDDWVDPLLEAQSIWDSYVSASGILKIQDMSKQTKQIIRRAMGNSDKLFLRPTKALETQSFGFASKFFALKLLRDGEDSAQTAFAAAHVRSALGEELGKAKLVRDALHSARVRRRKEYRAALREHLTEYLACVNANLVLSHSLRAGFHDWEDFAPFYREKFLTIGRGETDDQKRVRKSKQLFEVAFPTFGRSCDAGRVLKVLKDSRVADLRLLVDKAVADETEFDKEFANQTLQEVVKIGQLIDRRKRVLSYVSSPLGLVPFVGTMAQKAIEEIGGRMLESAARKPFRWYYLVSELTDR